MGTHLKNNTNIVNAVFKMYNAGGMNFVEYSSGPSGQLNLESNFQKIFKAKPYSVTK